jgi:hypothetical protein
MVSSLLPSFEENGSQLAELGESILACLAQPTSGRWLSAS